ARSRRAVRVHRVTRGAVPTSRARRMNPRLDRRRAPSASRWCGHAETAAPGCGPVARTGRIQSVAAGDARLIDREALAVHRDRARARSRRAVRVHRVTRGAVTIPGARRMNPRLDRRRAPTATRWRGHAETAASGTGPVARTRRGLSLTHGDARLIDCEALHVDRDCARARSRRA